jgi:WD40 repeat protein
MTLALSDYSMMHYSLEHLKPIWTIKGAHKKKIAQLCTVDEKLVCSASSDATLKLFDVTAGKEIQTLRSSPFVKS